MQTRDYATKKKGKTEVQPFWNMSDIKNVVEWFEKNNELVIHITHKKVIKAKDNQLGYIKSRCK